MTEKKESIPLVQKRLKDDIKSNEEELERLVTKLKSLGNRDLVKERMEETKRLEGLGRRWFSFHFNIHERRAAERNIEILQYEIAERYKIQKDIEVLRKKIEKDKEELAGYSQVLQDLPRILSYEAVAESIQFFENLKIPITDEIPYINILMIGETGSGKSSIYNAFATALEDSTLIKKTYKTAPIRNGESVTRKINLAPLYIRGRVLPIRFYDMPGICEENCVRQNELEMILNGELKQGLEVARASEMRKMTTFIRPNPTPADKIHCILYVMRATSNFSTKLSTSFNEMKKIQDSRKNDDEVQQFVIITAIDEIGVPNEEMAYAYQFPCVQNIRDKVVDALKILPSQVIPVSNYFVETFACEAKKAMSLLALWQVCKPAEEYLKLKFPGKDLAEFYE